jgi:hypothetical protein
MQAFTLRGAIALMPHLAPPGGPLPMTCVCILVPKIAGRGVFFTASERVRADTIGPLIPWKPHWRPVWFLYQPALGLFQINISLEAPSIHCFLILPALSPYYPRGQSMRTEFYDRQWRETRVAKAHFPTTYGNCRLRSEINMAPDVNGVHRGQCKNILVSLIWKSCLQEGSVLRGADQLEGVIHKTVPLEGVIHKTGLLEGVGETRHCPPAGGGLWKNLSTRMRYTCHREWPPWACP